MTARQARKERREAQRKAARLAYRASKTAAAEIGFVSQNSAPDPPAIDREDPLERARQQHLIRKNQRASKPPVGFVSQDSSTALHDRVEINRRNARFSTGPRTAAGKLASSGNALQHGLASGQPIIAGEDPAAFESLLNQLRADHQPADSTENLLVEEMAQSFWLTQRAIRLQHQCFTPDGIDEKRLSLFLRYQSTHQRSFYKALETLRRLQKDRSRTERGFVSHTAASRRTNGTSVQQNNGIGRPEHDRRLTEISQKELAGISGDGFAGQNSPVHATAEREKAA